MSKSTQTASTGFPVLGLLGLVFVTLKLAEIGVVATWSWLWVTSPFWLPIAVVLGCFVIFGAVYGLCKIFGK